QPFRVPISSSAFDMSLSPPRRLDDLVYDSARSLNSSLAGEVSERKRGQPMRPLRNGTESPSRTIGATTRSQHNGSIGRLRVEISQCAWGCGRMRGPEKSDTRRCGASPRTAAMKILVSDPVFVDDLVRFLHGRQCSAEQIGARAIDARPPESSQDAAYLRK